MKYFLVSFIFIKSQYLYAETIINNSECNKEKFDINTLKNIVKKQRINNVSTKGLYQGILTEQTKINLKIPVLDTKKIYLYHFKYKNCKFYLFETASIDGIKIPISGGETVYEFDYSGNIKDVLYNNR